MSFDVAADSYTRFMGRWSQPLAGPFADFAGVTNGVTNGVATGVATGTVLDVGCGPGALTAALVERVGPAAVAAVDPSPSFVAAAQARFPGADVRAGSAEALPYADDTFAAALAQLVVHFMADPVRGLAEMARVTRPGGVVAACVWDHQGGAGPLAAFWSAVRALDPDADDESGLPGTRAGHLGELATQAGLVEVQQGSLAVTLTFATFEAWWSPFTLGVGPAGGYVQGLDEPGRHRLRQQAAALLPQPPITLSATAWCVRGRAPG